MTLGQAREAALLARRAGGIGEDGPVTDIVRLVEDGGVLVFGLPFGRGSIAGLYELARERPFIAVNSDDPAVRQRFTLAHEYGHHRLGHGARLDERIEWGSSDPRERDSNEFAACLLMPAEAIVLWLQARESAEIDLDVLVRLAAAFGLSAMAARIRLERVGQLTRARAKNLDKQIAAGEHTARHNALGLGTFYDTIQSNCGRVRLPAGTEQKMLELVREELLPLDAAAARLGVSSEELRRRALGDDEDCQEDA